MFSSRALAAYLFVTDQDLDPNYDISNDEINSRLHEANNVINGLLELKTILVSLNDTSEASIQYHFYEIAKKYGGESGSEIRNYFKRLYQIFFNQTSGPRWGQFVSMLGIEDFVKFIDRRLKDPFSFGI